MRATLLAAKARFQMLAEENLAAIETAGAAIAMARELGTRAIEGNALTTLGTAMGETGSSDAGITHIREGLAIAMDLGAVHDTMRALVNLGNMLSAAGRSDEADAVQREGIAHAARLGVERNTGVLFLHNIAAPAALKGDWAFVDAVQSQIEGNTPSGVNLLEVLGVGVISASDRGEQVRAAELLDEARRRAGDLGTVRSGRLLLRHEILVALRSGDPTRAASLGRPPVGQDYHPQVAWLVAQAHAARMSAARSAGDDAASMAIAEEAVELLRDVEKDLRSRSSRLAMALGAPSTPPRGPGRAHRDPVPPRVRAVDSGACRGTSLRFSASRG